MAAIAGCWCIGKHIIRVAGCTGQRGVRARERISRIFQMVELRVEPAVHGVARLAGCWEARRGMVQHRCFEVCLMAGVARRCQARKLPGRSVLVTVVALQQCMRAHQWEPILMIANLLERCLPALHRMATLAVGSELPAMNVGVAIGAARAHVLECQAEVALCARHICMHTAQRIAGLVMIEFRIRANRFPTRVAMALHARNRDGPMRIGYLGLRTPNAWPWIVGRLLQRCACKQREQSGGNHNNPASSLHRSLCLLQRAS